VTPSLKNFLLRIKFRSGQSLWQCQSDYYHGVFPLSRAPMGRLIANKSFFNEWSFNASGHHHPRGRHHRRHEGRLHRFPQVC
jgi:hypothetical protein